MVTDLLSGPATGDWGDEPDYAPSPGIPPQEVVHNNDGTKTITDYSMSEDGYLQKTVTTMKVETVTKTVSKGVANRKLWTKFGECEGKPPGLERGITTVSIDEIPVEWLESEDKGSDDEEEANFAQMAAKDVQSRLRMQRFMQRQEERRMGAANWAQAMSMKAAARNPDAAPAPGMGATQNAGNVPGKYVPPSKRAGGNPTSTGDNMYSRDDSATVRISNVSRTTTEADLDELCRGFGHIRRIFLSRDRETGESKGFAFVAFANVADAARCIERLNGYGYDHLILSVEWSKPKEQRDGDHAR